MTNSIFTSLVRKIMVSLSILALLCGLLYYSPVQAQTEDSETLVAAAGNGDMKRLKTLISEGSAVDSKDSEGVTALIEASYAGHKKIVGYLLKSGANPNIVDEAGDTPLSEALSRGHEDIAILLLKGGAVDKGVDDRNRTLLHRAIELKNVKLINAAITAGADLNVKSKNGAPLAIAIRQKDVKIAKILLDAGAKPKFINNAVYNKQSKIINLLIKAGAKATPTVMQYAVMNDKNLLKRLLGKSSNITRKNLNAALNSAVKKGDMRLVKDLIKRGANINAFKRNVNVSYEPALLAALRANKSKIAKYLIKSGADIRAGRTGYSSFGVLNFPISWAAIHGHRDIVKTMMRAGVNTEDPTWEIYRLFKRKTAPLFSDGDIIRALNIFYYNGVSSDSQVRSAISDRRIGLVHSWYPFITNWWGKGGKGSQVAYVYTDLIRFSNENKDCTLKRGVKKLFTAKTGYRPPKEYDSRYREIADRC